MADWDEGDHPRDSDGKFTSGGAALKAWAARGAPGLEKQVKENPMGFSWRPDVGAPKDGIMVAEHPDKELGAVFDPKATSEKAIKDGVRDWVKKVADRIGDDDSLYFGGWQDSEGKVYLDVSRRWPEKLEEEAKRAGARNNQKEIWHVTRKEGIPTGGTGEKTSEYEAMKANFL